jgi:hypothetical protein
MNIVLGTVGANLTFGVISGIASATNGVYSLAGNIARSTANGANEVKQIIKESDLEVKVKTVQFLLCEIKIDEMSPYTLLYCVESIKDAIQDIAEELEKIHYRMQYNNNLWIGLSFRAYKFHNCRTRLHAKLKNLESRSRTLIGILAINNKMYKNNELEKVLSRSIQCVDKIEPMVAGKIRDDLQKNLMFINNGIRM